MLPFRKIRRQHHSIIITNDSIFPIIISSNFNSTLRNFSSSSTSICLMSYKKQKVRKHRSFDKFIANNKNNNTVNDADQRSSSASSVSRLPRWKRNKMLAMKKNIHSLAANHEQKTEGSTIVQENNENQEESDNTNDNTDSTSTNTNTVFHKMMTEGGHVLKTYRRDYSGGFANDLPSIYELAQTNSSSFTKSAAFFEPHFFKGRYHHHRHRFVGNTILARRSHYASYASSPSWPSQANGWHYRLSDAGTLNKPFSAKLHPNFITKEGGFCFLCGSYAIGGRDHHISFDRDHIALSYFYFLVCTMRREWDPQGLLRESAKQFPAVWERMLAPPLKFHRYFKEMSASTSGASHQVVKYDATTENESVRRKTAIEKFEFKKQKLSPYMKLETLSEQHYTFATGEQHPDAPGTNKTTSQSPSNKKKTSIIPSSSSSLLSKQQQEFLRNQQLLRSHQETSASAFSSPEALKRAILNKTDRSFLSNASLERELQKLQGDYAMSFAPTWWALQELQQNRIELQALLTVAMDTDAEFFKYLNDGGSLATKSAANELPPGLVGQGEKTFRADVLRVMASVMPVAAPMVTAAFAQKCWGRTNLSRLYDSLHIERIHSKVLGKSVIERQGRSEKSAVMRQLLTELHYAITKAKDFEEAEGDDVLGIKLIGEEENDPAKVSTILHQKMLSAQLAEMILSKLGAEAVLTMSHIYMTRAAHVAALTGYPTPEEIDRVGYE